MSANEFLSKIWNQKFSTTSQGKGIFKIYFKDFPDSCYLGLTDGEDGTNFKSCLNTFKLKLWKVFSGISSHQQLAKHYLLTQTEYANLPDNQRSSYEWKLAQRREQKLTKINFDDLEDTELRFWKIIIFLKMNDLQLTDLRFEVLIEQNSSDFIENLINKYRDLMRETSAWIKGFNPELLVEYIFEKETKIKVKDSFSLSQMLALIADQEANVYHQWNSYWNLYQLFRISFLKNPFGWLNFWQKISLAEIAPQFEQLTRLIFQENENEKMPNVKSLPLKTVEAFKHYSHQNIELILNNHRQSSFKNKIKIDQWVANDTDYFLTKCEEQNLIDQDYFEFFGSWEEITEFFTNNPFKNTKGFSNLIQPRFEECLLISSKLKAPVQLLKDYHRLTYFYYYQNLRSPDLYAGDLLFDYYYQKNFLNFFLFQ